MCNEYKIHSQSFEKVKSKHMSLSYENTEPNWQPSCEVSNLKTKIAKLKTENERVKLKI